MPVPIEQIIRLLRLHRFKVDGPRIRNGESIYRINEHTLTEREIRFLAAARQLTSSHLYEYVSRRGANCAQGASRTRTA